MRTREVIIFSSFFKTKITIRLLKLRLWEIHGQRKDLMIFFICLFMYLFLKCACMYIYVFFLTFQVVIILNVGISVSLFCWFWLFFKKTLNVHTCKYMNIQICIYGHLKKVIKYFFENKSLLESVIGVQWWSLLWKKH